jgi:putative transposase
LGSLIEYAWLHTMTAHDRDRIFYRWRQMSEPEREAALAFRRQHRRPWHNPPHYNSESGLYLITAACYEHRPIIGHQMERLSDFSGKLLETCRSAEYPVFGWVVLPNHYHVLLRATDDIQQVIGTFGRLHGSTSYRWNAEDDQRGRKVWFNAMETGIRTERHFWATLLYVLNNAAKHRYVEHWADWPFSNGRDWLDAVGEDESNRLWKEFPIDDYGKEWDPADL